MRSWPFLLWIPILGVLASCDTSSSPIDASSDAVPEDADELDGPPIPDDGSSVDAVVPDAPPVDAAVPDAAVDAAVVDAELPDVR
jgi:hypothetical protein